MNQPTSIPIQSGSPVLYQPAVAQAVAPPLGALALPSIPGISLAGQGDTGAPVLLLTAREKYGKSTTAITTSVGWPTPAHQPLVLAFDDTGYVSCLKVGYNPHFIKVSAQSGGSFIEQTRTALKLIENNRATIAQQYGVIIVDCISTATERLHECARQLPKNINNPDTRAPYNEMGQWLREIYNRLRDLQLPIIYLAWQLEAQSIDTATGPGGQKRTAMLEGGADIMGTKARNAFTGKAQMIFTLERQKHQIGGSVTTPQGLVIPADSEGFVRLLHARPFAGVNAGGRFAHLLPEVCPPHFGWILTRITGKGNF